MESKYKSSATTMFAVWQFISPFRIIILSFNSLEYMSYALSPPSSFSMIVGIKFIFLSPINNLV